MVKIVGKYTAISMRKVQLSYFHGEKTNFKTKILVSRTKIYEFFEKKFLNFSVFNIRFGYDFLISQFGLLKTFGDKSYLQKILFFC